MIVCSCNMLTDTDIELALVEIMSQREPPLPTPGVVYRHLQKKMVCCGCAPLAVSTIYEKIDGLARRGLICPYACASAQGHLARSVENNPTERSRLSAVRRRIAAVHGHPVMQDAMALKPA